MAAYRRGIFLINKRFQLRFAVYVCSWLLALSFVYPLIIYNLFDYFGRFLAQCGVGEASSVYDQTKTEVFWLLILFQVLLVVLTFVVSIFISHRIAGPIYKLSRFFADAATGHYHDDLLFRKKDHFKELADDFNIMMRGVRHTVEKKSDAILTAIPKLELAAEGAPPAVRAEIDAALAALREARD